MEIEQRAPINKKSDEKIVKENEETKERNRIRNRDYQRAWRQRKKDLKKKVSKEEKEEKKRKRHRENQRAYYHRKKGLTEKYKNVEELSQKKSDDLQIQSASSTMDDPAKPSTSGQNCSNDPISIKLEICPDNDNVLSSPNASIEEQVNYQSINELDTYDNFAQSIVKKIKSINSFTARDRLMNAIQNLVDDFCFKNAYEIDIATNAAFESNNCQKTVYVPMTSGVLLTKLDKLQSVKEAASTKQVLQPVISATSQPDRVPQITIEPQPGYKLLLTHQNIKEQAPAKRRRSSVSSDDMLAADNYIEVPVEATIPIEFDTAKPLKTKAEYQKAYREREKAKKNENKQGSSAKPRKTKAEYQKEYRERQKAKKKMNKQERSAMQRKTNAEYQKEYRERQKAKKKINKQERSAIPPKTKAEYQKAFMERQKINKRERSLSPKADGTAEHSAREAKPLVDMLEIKEENIQFDQSSSTLPTSTTSDQPVKDSALGIMIINDPIPIKLEMADDEEDI